MSPPDGYSKCLCKNCGERIEFPSAGAGSTVPCPHCQWPTVLGSDVPATTVRIRVGARPAKRRYQIFVVAVAVAIAAGAALFRFWYLPGRNQRAVPAGASNQVTQTAPGANSIKPAVVVPVPPPDPWHGLTAGPIALEKATDGHLIYAVGKLLNTTDHQRFGVKVDLDVFNANQEKVGTATDYTPSIEPGKEWKFRALVIDRNAATAQLTSVKEN